MTVASFPPRTPEGNTEKRSHETTSFVFAALSDPDDLCWLFLPPAVIHPVRPLSLPPHSSPCAPTTLTPSPDPPPLMSWTSKPLPSDLDPALTSIIINIVQDFKKSLACWVSTSHCEAPLANMQKKYMQCESVQRSV